MVNFLGALTEHTSGHYEVLSSGREQPGGHSLSMFEGRDTALIVEKEVKNYSRTTKGIKLPLSA